MLCLFDFTRIRHFIIARARNSVIVFLKPYRIYSKRKCITSFLRSIMHVFGIRHVILRPRTVYHHFVHLSVISSRASECRVYLREILLISSRLWVYRHILTRSKRAPDRRIVKPSDSSSKILRMLVNNRSLPEQVSMVAF